MNKILHVTYRPALDPNEYSGISKGIHTALINEGHDAINCSLQSLGTKLLLRAQAKFSPHTDPLRSTLLLALFKKRLATALCHTKYDLVLASFYRHLSGLNTATVQCIVWADTSFLQAGEYYPDLKKNSREFKEHAKTKERHLIKNASTHAFSNNWAKHFHIMSGETKPESTHCIHYGPNLDEALSDHDIDTLWHLKNHAEFQLFFPGVNFFRKGGDILVKACDILQAQGLKLVLHAVGCHFPAEYQRSYIKNHGFLDRRLPENNKLYHQLWHDAHLCILPTRADCLPQVLLEACYYGIPAIATDTGGVRDAILDGANGKTLPEGSPTQNWAEAIKHTLTNENLKSQSKAARVHYHKKFTWSDNVRQLLTVSICK